MKTFKAVKLDDGAILRGVKGEYNEKEIVAFAKKLDKSITIESWGEDVIFKKKGSQFTSEERDLIWDFGAKLGLMFSETGKRGFEISLMGDH